MEWGGGGSSCGNKVLLVVLGMLVLLGVLFCVSIKTFKILSFHAEKFLKIAIKIQLNIVININYITVYVKHTTKVIR